MYSISRAYGLSLESLKKLNGRTTHSIYVGDQLVVGYETVLSPKKVIPESRPSQAPRPIYDANSPIKIIDEGQNSGPESRIANRLFGVYFGASKFPNSRARNLPGADNDVKALSNCMFAQKGFFYENVENFVLRNKSASREDMAHQIRSINRVSKEGDLIMILISSHGERLPNGKLIMYSYDYTYGRERVNYFTIDDLISWLNGTKGDVLVMLDLCYSGQAGADLLNSELPRDLNIGLMVSATASELSGENGNGYLTYSVLKAFTGAADFNRDFLVDLNELKQYIEQDVSATSNNQQHASMPFSRLGNIPLVRLN